MDFLFSFEQVLFWFFFLFLFFFFNVHFHLDSRFRKVWWWWLQVWVVSASTNHFIYLKNYLQYIVVVHYHHHCHLKVLRIDSRCHGSHFMHRPSHSPFYPLFTLLQFWQCLDFECYCTRSTTLHLKTYQKHTILPENGIESN